jgi:hypothetical protein
LLVRHSVRSPCGSYGAYHPVTGIPHSHTPARYGC